MDERSKQVGQFVLAAARESVLQNVSEHGDDMHRRGFTAAAAISLRHIDAKRDSYREQMKARGLSKAEQVVYAELDSLKSEIEEDCDRYWRGSGLDWRPLAPVAKGTVSQPE